MKKFTKIMLIIAGVFLCKQYTRIYPKVNLYFSTDSGKESAKILGALMYRL